MLLWVCLALVNGKLQDTSLLLLTAFNLKYEDYKMTDTQHLMAQHVLNSIDNVITLQIKQTNHNINL